MYMNSLNTGFDPIVFLNIDTEKLSEKQKYGLSEYLNKSIAEYLSIKLLGYLSEEQIKILEDNEEMLKDIDSLTKLIPDGKIKILAEIENFRKEFAKK